MQRVDKALEKLLEIAEKGVDSEKVYSDDLLNFISKYDIRSGNIVVPSNVLYNMYKLNSSSPIAPTIFMRRMKAMVESKTELKKTNFYINVSPAKVNVTFTKKVRTGLSVTAGRKIFEFLKSHDIKRGTSYIEGPLVYQLFKEWMKAHSKRHISYIPFLNAVKRAVNIKRVKSIDYLGLNQNLRETYITPDKEKKFLRNMADGKKAVKKRQKKIRST